MKSCSSVICRWNLGRNQGIMVRNLLVPGGPRVWPLRDGIACTSCRPRSQTVCKRAQLFRGVPQHCRFRFTGLQFRVRLPRPLRSHVDSNSVSRQSTSTLKGWATPFVPSLLETFIVLIASFVLWEIRRESKSLSVLLPMSIWSQL